MDREQERYKVLTRRAVMLAGGQIALFGALAVRMYYLQVLDAERYKMLAEENRISLRLLAPRRGRIIDRFGVPLAVNKQNFRVVLVPDQAGDIETTLDAIGMLIPFTDLDRHKVRRDIRHKHSFVPVVVRDNVTWQEMSRIEVNAPELPGVSIEVGATRYYPFGDRTSNVVGYVAPVSEKELNGDPLLELPDFLIGKSGLEKAHDLQLRGSAGSTQIEVNAFGRTVREIGREDGVAGEEVVTTLDMWLQDFAYRRLSAEQSATCTVLDAVTGEVLVLASSPGFDGNAFSQGLTPAMWHQLMTDPLQPLIDKAIQGEFAPGSTFKPCVALAGLETQTITPDFRVTCSGVTRLGDREFHCWWHQGHGTLDLHGAIKNSCDIYFYELARRLGPDKIAAMAHRLGFGQVTGLDVPNERPGLIPTKAWKLARFGQRWADGETYSIGIGQGYITATPLQLAIMVARLVTNREITPRLVREGGMMKPGGQAATAAAAGDGFTPLGVDPQSLAVVLGGMNAVTNEPGGTAYAARITQPGMEMGGKSGTAQVRQITAAERAHGLRKPDQLPWVERDNALFIAFAPVSAPRYVCAVVVEHGIGGSKVAAPIARDVLRECQRRDPGRQVPDEPLIVADENSPNAPPPPPLPVAVPVSATAGAGGAAVDTGEAPAPPVTATALPPADGLTPVQPANPGQPE